MEPNQEKDTITTTSTGDSSATSIVDTPQENAPSVSTPDTPATESSPVVETPSVSAPEQTNASVTEPTQSFCKKHMTLIASVVAIVILGGAGYFAYSMYYQHGGVVATVNGTRIYADELNENITYLTQGAAAQGVDTTDASIQTEIRTQALDILVNNALILSAASDADITVTDEDVQAKYDELLKQLGSEEELEKRMGEMNLTKEKLLSNIKDRMIADAYISTKSTVKDLAVTEEEINEFIKGIDTGEAKLPPLEEIRPQIEAQILSQKQQELIARIIAELRDSSDVVIK